MKLVVLDGYTLNPGDLSWDALKDLVDVTIHERIKSDEASIRDAIGDADAVITNKIPLQKAMLTQLPNLKYIGVTATGYNIIDVDAAKEQGVTVTNVPAYSTASVAQFTMALVLELCHHVGDHNAAVQSGQWENSKDFCFWNSPLIELEGKTIGIIGFGQIGKAAAALAQAFGLNVLVYNRTVYPEYDTESCRFVSLDELLQASDFVSLHCPMTPDTAGIINAETLSKMKSSAFLINTSRGGLVEEADLAEALESEKIAGAAVDVVSEEPIVSENPLLGAKNCIITPHIAWAPLEARRRCLQIAVNNVETYINGEAQNVVS
ncbi:D-2-hydroxyacid dehydrogenase [Formosa algae]|uniref:Glycerate dehydrogenase n=1 Tax=Formosa algae TaxID=225843 RepID=A0A9X1CBW1_9FLAO|nr:D-2-hydroxyacid dehydrogenase [Formosa algae]MBP1840437.1 glycerate dehydrogenase [Formosa algae]MDQ0336929.1 glycerate dehydrogenase [Formosa algae]OEI80818.1 glycerate dehydrogenase [Formosa algae]